MSNTIITQLLQSVDYRKISFITWLAVVAQLMEHSNLVASTINVS